MTRGPMVRAAADSSRTSRAGASSISTEPAVATKVSGLPSRRPGVYEPRAKPAASSASVLEEDPPLRRSMADSKPLEKTSRMKSPPGPKRRMGESARAMMSAWAGAADVRDLPLLPGFVPGCGCHRFNRVAIAGTRLLTTAPR